MKIFYLPDLGEGLAEAEIREWYVKEGDAVVLDQPLVSMETAKAIVDVPSPYTGKIIKLHGQSNDIIKTGAPFISFELEHVVSDQGSVVGKLETSEKPWSEVSSHTHRTTFDGKMIKVLPAARALAKQMNVDLASVRATHPAGYITVEDVRSYFSQSASAVNQTSLVGGESLHGVQRTMAQVMQKSHREVVSVTLFEDADITDLPQGTDITVHLIRAIIFAANAEPALNAWFDGAALQKKLLKEINVGLAVDTSEGLFVPVIRHAEAQSAGQLRDLINKYKTAVRTRHVSPQDFQEGTIILSNFGTIAGRYGTPIIVPPMVAIVGCGKSREVALVKNGQLQAGKILPISLSFDHRAVTGGEATRFLGKLIRYIEGVPPS
ncbi:MAG TPA: dihydrolipoamide acetyltransferase family protein [Gammaproteobacteria bacterium]|jgi:pyruvate dehydrogenase E2 component (dihydrolipoamide acetyltransferase)|nr:dihydrolipoamide acetyltransferase family protein [Gammaproteobacteria bacterium]